MPKVVKKAAVKSAPVKKVVTKKVEPRPRRIEAGERVTVTTEYVVKRVVNQQGVILITCEDQYNDRVVTFRQEELTLAQN